MKFSSAFLLVLSLTSFFIIHFCFNFLMAPSYNFKVRIYTQDMVLLRELEGHQTGSYFGESVAASDLNDDG